MLGMGGWKFVMEFEKITVEKCDENFWARIYGNRTTGRNTTYEGPRIGVWMLISDRMSGESTDSIYGLSTNRV